MASTYLQPVVKIEKFTDDQEKFKEVDATTRICADDLSSKEIKKEIVDDVVTDKDLDKIPNDCAIDSEKVEKHPETSSEIQKSDVEAEHGEGNLFPACTSALVHLYRKPFEFGWRRELVLRASGSDSKKNAADVYYFAPCGKKLRSLPQLQLYIQENVQPTLNISNFTFVKKTVYKSPFEITRCAGSTPLNRGRKPGKSSPLTVAGQPEPAKRPRKMTHEINKELEKDTGTVAELDDDVKGSVSPIVKGSVSPVVKESVSPVVKESVQPVVKESVQPVEPKTLVIFPDGTNSEARASNDSDSDPNHSVEESLKPQPTIKKQVKARKSFVRPSPDPLPPPVKRFKPNPTCGMNCPQLEGIPPSLACILCQKLHHPACVDVMNDVVSFVCIQCFTSRSEQVNDPLCVPNYDVPITSTPPMMFNLANVRSQVPTPGRLPSLPRLIRAPTKRPVQPTGYFPAPLMTTPVMAMPPNVLVNSNAYPLTSNIPTLPGFSVMTAVQTPIQTPIQPPPIQPMDTGSKVEASRGQILTLPQEIYKQLKKSGPIDLRVNGKVLKIDAKSFVPTSMGVQVVLPAGSLSCETGRTSVSILSSSLLKNEVENEVGKRSDDTPSPVNVKVTSPAVAKSANSLLKVAIPTSTVSNMIESAILNPNEKPTTAVDKFLVRFRVPGPKAAKNDVVVDDKTKDAKKSKKKMSDSRPYRSNISVGQLLYGYESLMKVFDYLDLPDLLRVAQVCKSWKNLVSNHSSMRQITIEDCAVKNWYRFGSFLLNRKTETLDLTGLELTGKFEQEWGQFTKILPKLRYLKKLSLGQCPPGIIYSVAQELPYLESLHAEHITETDREPDVWYTNATIDLSRLSSFRCLKELRLRGMAGLNTPSMAYTSLQRLSLLKNLEKLSLTSLKDVDGFELSFLDKLSLEDLEIGDCDNWTEENYAYLNSNKLTKLHLENGGKSTYYLSQTLPGWQSLKELDLIMYAVDESLGRALSKLTGLESLSICPDTRENDSLINRNTLLAVRDLKHLKYFLWCAVTSNNDDYELEFLRQGVEDSLFYGETGLTPPERVPDEISDNSDLEIDDEIAMIEGKVKAKRKGGDMNSNNNFLKANDKEAENHDSSGKENNDSSKFSKKMETDESQEAKCESQTYSKSLTNGNPHIMDVEETIDENGIFESKNKSMDDKNETSDSNTGKGLVKSPRKRTPKKSVSIEDRRRSNRRRKLKKSDDSEIAFITLETLLSILQFHLPDTDIRVDPITMK